KVALNVFGNVPIGEITKQHIEKIKAFLSETGIKGTTVRGRLSVLRTVLRWAYRNGYLTRVPDMPDMPPADYEHIVPPTVEELERILAVSPPHLQRVIILGSQLGVRVGPSELFRLTWQDVDLARRVVRVPNAQKGAKTSWREVPIRNSLHAVFSEWKRIDLESGATFVVNWKGKPVQNVKTAWRTALEKACVRRMRRYDLRHAFATEGMAVGIDPGTMASLMGHSSPLMLMKHYQHVMTKQKVAAVESLPDVDFAASLLKGNVTECVQEHVSKGKGATDKL
ncbi:MAG TPA: tyrosine-type recombinase/integrase, partial [Bilophila wadsworthia]